MSENIVKSNPAGSLYPNEKSEYAFVHSFQSLGAVDGPGLRFIIFMQGCPYHCPWCHNPDTRSISGGTKYSADELTERVLRYKTYFDASKGGVTLSGGEPLLQRRFVSVFFSQLQKSGINTALDTAGMKPDAEIEKLLYYTDVVLCDLKFPNEINYRGKIGISLEDVLDFLSLCEKMKKHVVIRHVIVPTLTDTPESVRRISDLAHSVLSNPRIELLPFRKLCQIKYDSLGLVFPLAHLPECTEDKVKELYRYI